jgi:hypothetical protein
MQSHVERVARVNKLLQAIVRGDLATVVRMLGAAPALARARVEVGATRQAAKEHFFVDIGHYVYAGDTALHVAAAAHQPEIARALLAAGADVRAKNRRGAEPLHYAADSRPGSRMWNPGAQAETITCLIGSGADANAMDKSGVAPLHRAVRTRGAAAVRALLEGGANAQQMNKGGSTPMRLATLTTGRGGSGSPEAKAEQAEIVPILHQASAGAPSLQASQQ